MQRYFNCFFKLTLVVFWLASNSVYSQEYQLVWADEFDGTAVDTSKWSFQIGNGCPNLCGWGNNELQYYRAENASVADGHLTITAKKENYEPFKYTSARMRTLNKGDWKYGKFEIRAKLPEGQGMWPAIWMLPTDQVYGTWAASGEIDIVELVGHEPDIVHSTLHHGAKWPKNIHTGAPFKLEEGKFSDGFRIFTAEWEKGEIRWFVGDSLYQTQTKWRSEGNAFPAPFDQKFHMILNLAVGGTWPQNPDSTTVFPQTMVIDYVRVYQKIE